MKKYLGTIFLIFGFLEITPLIAETAAVSGDTR